MASNSLHALRASAKCLAVILTPGHYGIGIKDRIKLPVLVEPNYTMQSSRMKVSTFQLLPFLHSDQFSL